MPEKSSPKETRQILCVCPVAGSLVCMKGARRGYKSDNTDFFSLFPGDCCCFRAILILYISFILPKGNTCVFLGTGKQPIFGLLSLDLSQCLSSSWLRTGAQSRISENSPEACV